MFGEVIIASAITASAITVSIVVNVRLSLKYQKKQATTDAARLALEM